jgi:23S rRNA pseudouridine1911/1915/1917 synthase
MTQDSRQTFRVPSLDKPERLDKFLIGRFPKTSRTYWRDRLASVVKVDGRPGRKGRLLKGGERIEVLLPPLAELPVLRPNAGLKLCVLYEDPYLLAVDKPAGLPSHPLREDETETAANAAATLYPELGVFSAKPLEAGLLHRLDNDTSGVLLFCRDEASLRRFRQLNREGGITKHYLAVVHGRPPARGKISVPLAHHPKNKKKMIPSRAARAAVTEYRRVKTGKNISLLHVRIFKGARHQIRVHLAHLGHPIVGDRLYEKRSSNIPATRHLLHAHQVELQHPFLKKKLLILSPPPKDFQLILDKHF